MKIAILHDGTFDGDSAFYAGTEEHAPSGVFVYNGENLGDLKQKMFESIKDVDEGAKELVDTVVGAWILDEKGIRKMEKLDAGLGYAECDSACYSNNRTRKIVASVLAEETLGVRTKP